MGILGRETKSLCIVLFGAGYGAQGPHVMADLEMGVYVTNSLLSSFFSR